MINIESSGITDIGRRRELNEDSFFYDDGMRLYVVADGMGGHNAGEVASELVVKTIRDYLNQNTAQDALQDPIKTEDKLSEDARRLLTGIHLSNHIVHQAALQNEDYKGMGSTVSAVYLTNETFIVANVGDSLVYLIRDGKIKLLSVPHTLVAEQAELDPENAELLWNDFKHVLTRAMGVDKFVKADIKEMPFFKNDILVISSDGLTDKATPEEILELVDNQRSDLACQKLVDLANARGGEDNITAIVLRIKSEANNNSGISGRFKNIFKKLFYTHLQPKINKSTHAKDHA
ncbi:MAG: protein phosphatase 2C domain-containing protein [Deltaproteobacteria bacterium]|nr:protein phosphatase 2C domain-containing protein [Deltaproteobacteria bacterium]